MHFSMEVAAHGAAPWDQDGGSEGRARDKGR